MTTIAKPRHFDPLRNVLPPNWTNENSTKYYNRCWWKKCKCELKLNTDCYSKADKWDPCGDSESKWSKGCSPCSSHHKLDTKYHHTYKHENCGCSETVDCDCKSKTDYSKYAKYTDCNCDEDVVIRYVANNAEISCSHLVELKFPVDGTKAKYLSQFSDEFIENNRFQCAIPAVYNNCPGNVIDNRKEEEFTESDQKALVSRSIRNKILAERVTTRRRHKHCIPSNVAFNSTYYYLGDQNRGSTQTGLYGPNITGKPYFDQCNC